MDKAKAASGDRRLFDAMGTEDIELLSALTPPDVTHSLPRPVSGAKAATPLRIG